MFYLIIFLVLSVLACLQLHFSDQRSTRIIIALAALIMIAVAGLRFETGGDWDTYTAIFNAVPSLSRGWLTHPLITHRHIGVAFVALCSLVKTCGGSIQTLFFIVSAVNISLIALALPKYTRYPVLGLLAYYCLLFFSLEMIYIRQATAVSLCFFALQYMDSKRLVPYMLLVALASLFHVSAIVMVPLYWILPRRIPTWAYVVSIGIGAVVMLIGYPWITKVFLSVSSWLGDAYYQRALIYTSSSRFAVERVLSVGFVLNLLLMMVFLTVKQHVDAKRYGTIHLNMFAMSLVLYYYCYELVEVSNRFRLFFLIGLIVLLPIYLEYFEQELTRYVALIPIALYLFLFSSAIFLEKPGAIAYNPYQNYLEYRHKPGSSRGKQRLEQSHKLFDQSRKR